MFKSSKAFLQSIKNEVKKLSFCHKLEFSNIYIFATQCRRPLIFQTMNSVRSNNLSLKNQWYTPSGHQVEKIFGLEKDSTP